MSNSPAEPPDDGVSLAYSRPKDGVASLAYAMGERHQPRKS